MFNYGHVDTTNIVKRHWQFIKYTALRGRINRSITDLLHVLIEDSEIGTCIGGTFIEWYKQRQEIEVEAEVEVGRRDDDALLWHEHMYHMLSRSF